MAEWDYIIVGAGSAGCALSFELAKDGKRRVLLIEAGGSNKSPIISVPGYMGRACRDFDWGYSSSPDPTRNGRSEHWFRGRVLGGSSSTNGMIYVRGASHDYDRWRALGNPGWDSSSIANIFHSLERSDGADALRGRTGQLSVRTIKRIHPLTDAFMASAVASGFALNPDYNGAVQAGVARLQLTQRHGFRCSAADAFLRPLRRMKNFTVMSRTTADRIIFQGVRAVGVEASRGSSFVPIFGDRIIVCAGAINSPKLLMLSGIGDPAKLRQHGIETRIASPMVGQNLCEHPLVRLTYKSRIPSHNLTLGLLQRLSIGLEYAIHREGPVASPIEAVAFLRSRPDLAEPNIQLHFVPMGLASLSESLSPILPFPSFSIYVNSSYPKSRGSIGLRSANPLDAPMINSRLLEAQADIDTLRQGIALVRSIMAQPPIRDLAEEEILPGREVRSDTDLDEYIRLNTELAYHFGGTCRMGSDAGAVVSPELDVRGVANLWIADASVMPDLISGNTNAACIMIGAKLGRELANRHPVSLDRNRRSPFATAA